MKEIINYLKDKRDITNLEYWGLQFVILGLFVVKEFL